MGDLYPHNLTPSFAVTFVCDQCGCDHIFTFRNQGEFYAMKCQHGGPIFKNLLDFREAWLLIKYELSKLSNEILH